jgi:hypothetical protein
MLSSDAAWGLALVFSYLAMMLWGVFQSLWPTDPDHQLPGGGRRVRSTVRSRPVPVRVRVRH